VRPRSIDNPISLSLPRFQFWYGFILVIFAVFVVRLFYLQVIQHNYYRQAALSGQFKEYEIPAERGVIVAYDGNQQVPIVLNDDVFTAFADPKHVTDPKKAAEALVGVIGGNKAEYEALMRADSRYSVLAKKLSKEKAEAIDKLELKGIGTRATSQRTYPQGALGATLLGFVDDEGNGKYGLEQFLDKELKGIPGELKAITDARGVPLVSNTDNILKEPVAGKRVAMTIDISMQRRVEDMLKSHLEEVRSTSGSVIIMDPNSGAIKAMANYPTFNPSEFSKVEDAKVFTNRAVSEPMEVGSVMKTLTVAAGLDSGAISENTTYYDPSFYKIGDATVRNVEEDGGSATRSTADILRYSLNTGATYILMQMGGGKINEQARLKWHDYMVNHFFLGQKTGIEQGYESEGFVPSPTEGFGLDIQYANTAFGQGVNVTPLQLAAAFSATINGGTYYKPHLLEPENSSQSMVLKKGIIRSELSPVLRGMHENSVAKNYTFLKRPGYRIGGKTGTAQIPKPEGGYYDDRFNGTYVGYVGGESPEYVIMVRIDEPKIGGYAGRAAAAPLFGKAADMLIGNYAVKKAN
jgi:cell division protein FtsI (penicillin-binding protein 3)